MKLKQVALMSMFAILVLALVMFSSTLSFAGNDLPTVEKVDKNSKITERQVAPEGSIIEMTEWRETATGSIFSPIKRRRGTAPHYAQ